MAAIGPTIISYQNYRTNWDDKYFMHRAVSLHRAVWQLDASEWAQTFSLITKSPILAFLSAPWGWVNDAEALIGLSRVTLTILTWAIILACLYLVVRINVPWWLSLTAVGAISFNPMLKFWVGAYLADSLLSWVVLLLLLLIPYESVTQDFTDWACVRRGLLWGAALSVGLLAKVTFWAFLLFAAPVVVFLRFRRGGRRATLLSLGTCLAVSAPAIVITIHYGGIFLNFALGASVGAVAQHFASPHEGYGPILLSYAQTMGAAGFINAALFIWAVIRRPIPAAWVSNSPSACLWSTGDYQPCPGSSLLPSRSDRAPVFAGHRRIENCPDPCSARAHTLRRCAGGRRPVFVEHGLAHRAWARPRGASHSRKVPVSRSEDVVLASDSPDWNIETFLLARELMGGTTTGIRLRTVVYSVMQQKPISADFLTFQNSDAVVIETPTSSNPAALNARTDQYRGFVQSYDQKVDSGVKGLDLFRHR